jgi:hypothetical protein
LPHYVGGPSVFCISHTCNTSYPYYQLNESGMMVFTDSITLNHVVNVIDVSGTENGWVEINQIPVSNFNIFGFSFNSASSTVISTNWDAIFEGNLRVH